MSRIHETALVDPAAEIADDVEIGAFSIVGPKVSIGPGSRSSATYSSNACVRRSRRSDDMPTSSGTTSDSV